MILRSFIRAALVYALVLGVSALPGFVSVLPLAVHSQTGEAARHQALEPVEIVDQSHSHFDGEDYEKQLGHNHGHDPADHSHQVVFISHTDFTNLRTGSDSPRARDPDLIKLETDFDIDRPPKGSQCA